MEFFQDNILSEESATFQLRPSSILADMFNRYLSKSKEMGYYTPNLKALKKSITSAPFAKQQDDNEETVTRTYGSLGTTPNANMYSGSVM